MPPRASAEQIVAKLNENPQTKELISAIQIAGPGFINMTLSEAAKQAVIPLILKEGAAYGCSDEHTGQSVLLEYVSANPTGPLHLGHARQAALGDVLSRMLKSQGWSVTREFYYNDAGVQIYNLAISVQARAKELQGENIVFPEDGYHGSISPISLKITWLKKIFRRSTAASLQAPETRMTSRISALTRLPTSEMSNTATLSARRLFRQLLSRKLSL